mgnify:CR=1 FL=1
MKTNVADSKQVKLSCRNVWKVYGSGPEKFFNKANGQVSDAATHADTIRKQQHIVANANVSFDVAILTLEQAVKLNAKVSLDRMQY